MLTFRRQIVPRRREIERPRGRGTSRWPSGGVNNQYVDGIPRSRGVEFFEPPLQVVDLCTRHVSQDRHHGGAWH